MLRRCLIAAALVSFAACKKADSKDVPASTAGDSRVTTPVKASGDAPDEGSATPVTVEDKGSQVAEASGSGTAKTKPQPKSSGQVKAGTETTTGDDSYQLTVSPPGIVEAGKPAVARLTVKPIGGYHMNDEFPTELKLTPPEGVTMAKTVFALEDAEKFDKDQLVFAVECTPGATGEYTVSGKFKFAVCTDATCDPKRQSISFTVAAK